MLRTRFIHSLYRPISDNLLRAAIFSYIFARHQGGEFVLRIDDITGDNSKEKSDWNLWSWLNLDWDEGPGKEDKNETYTASERKETYQSVALKLIEQGRAYYCFCDQTEDKGKGGSDKKIRKSTCEGKCRHLSPTEQEKLLAQGIQPSIRIWNDGEVVEMVDGNKGRIRMESEAVKDFVLIRPDGYPSYSFMAALDDILMEISHVFRPDDYLNETLRQAMVCRVLGMQPPVYIHLSEEKKGERHVTRPVSLQEYIGLGYLPEVVFNFYATWGWNPPDGREILSREEIIASFTIEDLSVNSLYQTEHLYWLAQNYLLNRDGDVLFHEVTAYLEGKANWEDVSQGYLRGIVEMVRGYCLCLSDFLVHFQYFLSDEYELSPEVAKMLSKEENRDSVLKFYEELKQYKPELNEENAVRLIEDFGEKHGKKGRKIYQPLKAALTGQMQGPEVYLLLPVWGKENCLRRLERVLNYV